MNFLGHLLLISALLIRGYQFSKPAYEVLVNVNHGSGNINAYYCSAVILQWRVVLTTAACVNGLSPLNITIVGAKINRENIKIAVNEIHIVDEFNPDTLENNIAVLKLNSPLPLGDHKDFQWIVLGEEDPRNTYCYFNFHESNSPYASDSGDNVIQWINGQNKNNNSDNEESSMVLEISSFDCNNGTALSALYENRGAGVICESKLVAMLTTIYATSEAFHRSCHFTRANLYFTMISTYLEWIYEFVIEAEYEDMLYGSYAVSTPYEEIINSPIVASTQSSSLSSSSLSVELTSSESEYLTFDSAISNRQIFICLQLSVFFSFLFIY